jgi:histone-lysine N-methyltransferase SETD1
LYYKGLIEHVRKHASSAAVVQERIKGKEKGKESLYRYEGEVVGRGTESHERAKEPGVVRDEEALIVKDPRKAPGFKKLQNLRPGRSEFHEVKYEVSVCIS